MGGRWEGAASLRGVQEKKLSGPPLSLSQKRERRGRGGGSI